MNNSFQLFVRCFWRIILPPADTPVRWTRARLMAIFVWVPLCVALGLFHWLCLLLDELLFPGYRRVQVKQPVFIVGPPRGGTTFLHRVLAKDSARFSSYTFGEMVFTPSILQRHVLAFFARIDRALGRPIENWMRRFEKPFFDPYAYMHKVSVFEPEEDFVILGYVFANPLLLVVFPFPDLMGGLWAYDREVPPERVDRMLRFYKRCLQRHLYYHGADKQHLSKNPYFTSMMQGLLRTFPDAKFILNVRTPYENVPSFLSIWKALYQGIGNDPAHPLGQAFILDWLRDTYLHGGECIAQLDASQGAVVPYGPLVEKPRETIEAVYNRFGFEMSAQTHAVLETEEARAREYRSVHAYAIEEYGLTVEDIERHFAEVFERFEFPKRPLPEGMEAEA